MTQTEIMIALEHVGVRVVGTTQEFGTGGNGVWISAEDTPSLFDYWSGAWAGTFGVKPQLDKFIEACGWYFEWHDAGTIMAYPNV
jgi:hypothetical protein